MKPRLIESRKSEKKNAGTSVLRLALTIIA
jgi:hypothetical protein